MKNLIILITALLLTSTLTISSQEVSKKDEINAMKIAFITKKLDLSPEEAEKFWPLYNQYSARKDEVHTNKQSIGWYYVQNEATINDEEATDLLEKYVSANEQEGHLIREYMEKFKKILPSEKVLKLFVAEYQFKSHLLKELREQRRSRRP
ncbi:MAG: hypothetical protein ACOCW8_02615 [bacterium]